MPSLTISKPKSRRLDDAIEQAKGYSFVAHRQTWRDEARPEQVRPDDCDIFIVRGGRGSGKTRTGAEDALERMRSGDIDRIHIIAPTFGAARDVCIEGASGLKACAEPGEIINYNRSMGEVYFANGVVAKIYSGDEPDNLNGPQCGHLWVDEFYAVPIATLDQAEFGLRIGKRITATYTSTPKMTKSTKYVLAFEGATTRRLKTEDNAKNLAPAVLEKLRKKYGGTRLGKVELDGEVLEDVQGALWKREWFERDGFRVPLVITNKGLRLPPNIVKIVVAVDPSVTDPELKKNPQKDPDACGLGAAAVDKDGNGYVICDYTEIMSPTEWAQASVFLYGHLRAAGIIAEGNQGGELVRLTIKGVATNVPIEIVYASINKRARGEPVAVLYEQGRVKHCCLATRLDSEGEPEDYDTENLAELEEEMVTWNSADPSQPSPNRIDWLVWAFHGLGLCEVTGRSFGKRVKGKGKKR